MTRIVAGVAKGRRLAVPAQLTRPTSDRAREALFSSLASRVGIEGTRFLDLFAGSGAVGLEALSRGAAAVTLVESDRAACQALRANVAAIGLPGAEVLQRDAMAYLAAEANPAEPFDVAFADPPYRLDDGRLAELLQLLAARWLADEALVVVERSARSAAPQWPDTIEEVQRRRYGAGTLWYGRRR
jgi:16S rRNA (guanine966-N2)-methyltransferase